MLFLLTAAALACAPWCNIHTCNKGDCSDCEHCKHWEMNTLCEPWCNVHTCYDKRCAGCKICAKETDAPASNISAATPAAASTRTAAPPGWGCCADREAKACDACRWWANGGFCTKHAVNCATCGFALYCSDPSTTPPPAPPAPPPAIPVDLRCQSGRLVECRSSSSSGGSSSSCGEFLIKGVSWYGMEEKYAILQGLEKVSMDHLLNFIEHHGFNSVRVPLAVTSVLSDPPSSMFGGMVSQLNPHVHGFNYLAVLDTLITEAARRNLLILLDMHRLTAGDRNNPLWHDHNVHEEKLVSAWEMLAKRHCDSWNVIGADLFNEPWAASWGGASNGGPPHEDWAAAAERIGNLVSTMCPRWLLFVEGVSHTTASGAPSAGPGQSDYGHNWASNLEGVRTRPLKLATAEQQSKLVLSPHIYGPSVAPQPYFDESGFPSNMPQIWDAHFGFASSKEHGMCIVIGEWGGWFAANDAIWQKAFGAYLSKRQIGHFYWALNPTSRDTGGLVLADWHTPNEQKLTLLKSMPATSVGMATHEHHKHGHEGKPSR